MDGGKFKRRLSEVNVRAVARGQDELVGKFKMAIGDVNSIGGRFWSTFQKELKGSWSDLVWTVTGMAKLMGLLEETGANSL